MDYLKLIFTFGVNFRPDCLGKKSNIFQWVFIFNFSITFMRTLILFFFTGIFVLSKSFGQISPADKHIMDSLLRNDEIMKMINNLGKPYSYFRINIGVGNKLYSTGDKAIESLQNTSQFVISPSAAYYHKSGLGISFTGFLLTEHNKTDFYQYSLTPFYNYNSGKV